MKLENWLTRAAAARPEGPALVGGGRTITYQELEERARSAARRLAHLGVSRGERVALVVETSVDHAVLLHAVGKLGAVAVPIDPRLAGPELEGRLKQVRARLVVHDPGEVAGATEADADLEWSVDLDAPHSVLHTSGTGGRATAVELTHANHLWSAIGSGLRLGIDPADRWLCCLPLHHIGGLAILLRSVLYGTAVVLERFDPDALVETMRTAAITVVSLVPTMLQRLLDAGAELDRPRCVLLGGGPADRTLIERAVEAGVMVAPTYGLTEAASQVTTLAPGEARRRPGSAGTPLLPTEVRVDDEGVILIRGATVAPAAAGPDGWLRTGDLGRIDEAGHLHPLGRADGVIVSGGENVSPEEVEQALLAHPAVADAAVAGRRDPEWQWAVVATVVLADGARASEAELREFCRGRLAGYKVPKAIRFASGLPRNDQGKLLRHRVGDG